MTHSPNPLATTEKHKAYFTGHDFRAYFDGNTPEDPYTRGLCIESTVPLETIRQNNVPSIKVTNFSFGEEWHGVDLYVDQHINDDYCLLHEHHDGNFSLNWIGPVACATKADLTWDGYETYVRAAHCITATDFLAVKDRPSHFRRSVSSNIFNSSRNGALELLTFTRAADGLVLSEKWTTPLGERRRFVTIFTRLDL